MIDYGALFDEVYNEYYYKIVAYFRRRVKYDRDTAEDLAQQTFFKLMIFISTVSKFLIVFNETKDFQMQ